MRKTQKKPKHRANITKKNNNKKFIIGLISVPNNKGARYENSHIINKYLIKKFKSKYIDLLYIKYNDPKLYKVLDKIDALILPAASRFNMETCNMDNSHDFQQHIYRLYKHLKKINDNGRIFPVLSICYTYQMTILYEKYKKKLPKKFHSVCYTDDDAFEKVNMKNSNPKIFYTKYAKNSELFRDYIKNKKSDHIWHNNTYGFNYDKIIKKPWFINNYKPLCYSLNQLNTKVLQAVEHKKYPFFAIQFHPEYKTETRPLYDFFSKFIINNVKNNENRLTSSQVKSYNKPFNIHKFVYIISK